MLVRQSPPQTKFFFGSPLGLTAPTVIITDTFVLRESWLFAQGEVTLKRAQAGKR